MGRDYLMEQAEYLKKRPGKTQYFTDTVPKIKRIDYRRKAPCGLYDAK